MQHFRLANLHPQTNATEATYNEFLRVRAMSMGLYTIPAGATDPQSPHTEDEVYHVTAGRGWITVGNVEIPVETGSIVYVPALVEHRFHSVEVTLAVLVFFAPAEYALDAGKVEEAA